jgi:hypothetical protein
MIIVATELVLSYQDGRIRVVVQYAPVWEKDTEPGSCPPHGLKLFRVLVSKETLRDTSPIVPWEPFNDMRNQTPIVFDRAIPPYQWHKKWSGTSWTWGIQSGNQGWHIDEVDANSDDAWHGISPPSLWNLRLSGGVFIQCPRVITRPITSNDDESDDLLLSSTTATTESFRVAWLPNDDTLLRIDAGIVALQPKLDQKIMIGFEPPKLISYRCDILQNMGELENQPPTLQWDNNKVDEDEKPNSDHLDDIFQ